MKAKADILKHLRMTVYSGVLPDPAGCLSKQKFFQRSYQRWAVLEIIRALENSDGDPEQEFEAFIRRMDNYAAYSKSNGNMFSIAHDIAQVMYDEIFL